MKSDKFIYPKLPAKYTTLFFRIGGNGLANCLFVYAKAIISAKRYNVNIISPTWFNLSIGTYLRHQADKRHYLGIFNDIGEVKGLKRILRLATKKKYLNKEDFEKATDGILIEEGIYDFFEPLKGHSEYVNNYLLKHLRKGILYAVDNYDFKNCIAVHVRLGDFPKKRRVPMSWYKNQIYEKGLNKKVLLFSDGSDEELEELTSIPFVERVFFGGAIQDIIAISRCSYIIGSDSSFSAWGAYLGQVPCVFYKLQFGMILDNEKQQIIEISYE